MRQERKKERDKAAISLLLCFSVIAIASVFTVKSSIDKLNLQKRTSDLGTVPQIEQPVTQPIPTVDSKDNEDVKKQSESNFEAPISGKIITEFSANAPVYSNTLDQYMTHYGLDIAAPLDTQVKAIADGTVTKVYTDDKYGITVEINHGDGLTSLYGNLSTDSMTEVSDVVKKGQVISGVGDTSLFESLDESHLHFEMRKDGTPVDPKSYIDFN